MMKKSFFTLLDPPKDMFAKPYDTPSPSHIHAQWEVLIFAEGISKNTINETVYTDIHPGRVFVIGPPHRHNLETQGAHLHWDIYCDVDTMKKICADISPDLYDKLSTSIVQFHLRNEQLSHILNDLETITKLNVPSMDEKNAPQTILRSFTNSIVSYLLNIYSVQRLEKKIDIPTWLLDFVFELKKPSNFSKRANQIAILSNYSYPQLVRIFKKYFNLSLIDYLTHLRLEYAATLLTTTNFSVLAIANELGYANAALLNKKFKEKFGSTPVQYRKLHLVNNENLTPPPII